jgi:hypothetical protein
MVGSRPTAEFATVEIETATVAAGQRFGRLYLSRYTDPLGFGKTPSRFSDPRRRTERNRFALLCFALLCFALLCFALLCFAVLYLGESLKVCFLEAVLRDQRNGAVGDFLLSEHELRARRYAEIAIARELTLVDFRGDGAIRMGVPSDVVRGSQQSLSRWWSVAFHEHPQKPDGIIYPSRLNAETSLAIYDRAIAKLAVTRVTPLIAARGLANILTDLRVALVS